LRTPGSVTIEEPEDEDGFEFNRYTLTGEYDSTFKALIVQDVGRKLTDKEYFQEYLRNYIEHGVDVLNEEYQKINSPVEFLVGLASAK
jgi:DNA sulfur modification protein DndE